MAENTTIIINDEVVDSAELMELYKITTEDQERIRRLGKKAAGHMDRAFDEFYEWLKEESWFDEFFADEAVLSHVKRQQHDYWQTFMTADVDAGYVQRRHVVGEVHARIGLPLNAYFAAMNTFQEIIAHVMMEVIPGEDHAATLESMSKLMHLDSAIVAETYNRAFQDAMREQSDSIMAMSTPVTEIWDSILFLPIVGLIDSHRAREVMDSTLSKIADTQAQIFILDISGVGVVDTAVANNLFRITRATKLMGCESIISGVSPAIAQTIVDLGIDVGVIRTTGTMRDALALSFRSVGVEMTRTR